MIQIMLADTGDRLFLVVGATGASIGLILYIALEFYRARQREQTLREIAAYVAEGSITPVDGERLMRAAAADPEGGASDKIIIGKAEFGAKEA